MAHTIRASYPTEYAEQMRGLEQFLTELFKVKAPERVSVHAFECPQVGGLRIAEISISTETSGSSYQRGIPNLHSQALILAAEDFVRTFSVKAYRPQGWTTDLDEFADAQETLRYIVSRCTHDGR